MLEVPFVRTGSSLVRTGGSLCTYWRFPALFVTYCFSICCKGFFLLKYIKRTIKVLLIIKAPACGLFWARRRLTWVHVVSDRIFPAGGKDRGDFGGDAEGDRGR